MAIWGLVVQGLEMVILLTVAGIVLVVLASAFGSDDRVDPGSADDEVVERDDPWRR